MTKPTTDPQSMQAFSLSSAKFRGALLQLSFNSWEGKSCSWGWMDEAASGLSRGPVAATHCTPPQRKEKKKNVGHFRHLTSINCFETHGSVLPTSRTLLAMPLSKGCSLVQGPLLQTRYVQHPPTNKEPQRSPMQERALLRHTSPATALCWEPLSFLTQLAMRPSHCSTEGRWHTKRLYCEDPRCLQG